MSDFVKVRVPGTTANCGLVLMLWVLPVVFIMNWN